MADHGVDTLISGYLRSVTFMADPSRPNDHFNLFSLPTLFDLPLPPPSGPHTPNHSIGSSHLNRAPTCELAHLLWRRRLVLPQGAGTPRTLYFWGGDLGPHAAVPVFLSTIIKRVRPGSLTCCPDMRGPGIRMARTDVAIRGNRAEWPGCLRDRWRGATVTGSIDS